MSEPDYVAFTQKMTTANEAVDAVAEMGAEGLLQQGLTTIDLYKILLAMLAPWDRERLLYCCTGMLLNLAVERAAEMGLEGMNGDD